MRAHPAESGKTSSREELWVTSFSLVLNPGGVRSGRQRVFDFTVLLEYGYVLLYPTLPVPLVVLVTLHGRVCVYNICVLESIPVQPFNVAELSSSSSGK